MTHYTKINKIWKLNKAKQVVYLQIYKSLNSPPKANPIAHINPITLILKPGWWVHCWQGLEQASKTSFDPNVILLKEEWEEMNPALTWKIRKYCLNETRRKESITIKAEVPNENRKAELTCRLDKQRSNKTFKRGKISTETKKCLSLKQTLNFKLGWNVVFWEKKQNKTDFGALWEN